MADRELIGRFEKHTLPDDSVVYYEPDPIHRYYSEIKEAPKSKGGYSYVQGSQLTGVSTPVKALDTNVDPLLWWAARLDQTGIAHLAREAIASEDNLEWLCSQRSIDAALREAELTWDKVRDKSAIRGTNIHEHIFLALATGSRVPSLANLSAEERGYGQAALKWWHDHTPTPIYAEQVTFCADHNVAGRFDLQCDLNGEVVLVDAKTREKGQVRRGDHAQLAGYELCNVRCGIGPSDRQLALILTPWGDYVEHECLADEADFLAALDAYRRGGDLDKRMRAAEKQAREAVAA